MEDLKTLRQQMERRRHLEGVVSSLEAQRWELDRKRRDLDNARRKEQLDVERLEGHSLAAFFYAVAGKMDEKLDKERAEAYAAAVKYDAAARELAEMEEDLARRRAELEDLRDCEGRYQTLLRQQQDRLKDAGGAAAAEILALEDRMAAAEARLREIEEAADAGRNAAEATNQLLGLLDSAEGWSTWDLFGGGLLTDIAKYNELDRAQDQVAVVQAWLRQFRTELADVEIRADLDIQVDGFLRFADFFFDGLFADWTVRDDIHSAQYQARSVWEQIDMAREKLEDLAAAAWQEQEDLRTQLARLVETHS